MVRSVRSLLPRRRSARGRSVDGAASSGRPTAGSGRRPPGLREATALAALLSDSAPWPPRTRSTVVLWDVGSQQPIGSALALPARRASWTRRSLHPRRNRLFASTRTGTHSAGSSTLPLGASTPAPSPAASLQSSGRRSCPSRTTSPSVPPADDDTLSTSEALPGDGALWSGSCGLAALRRDVLKNAHRVEWLGALVCSAQDKGALESCEE